MVRKLLYKKTVDVLFNAFYKEILRFLSYPACAVAQLIRAHMEFKEYFPISWYKEHKEFKYSYGYDLLYHWNNLEEKIRLLHEIGLEEFERQEKYLRDTGYSCEELLRIVNAFDGCAENNSSERDYFKGLNAVLDVLRDIHQITEDDLLTDPEIKMAFSSGKIVDAMVERHESLTGAVGKNQLKTKLTA